MSEAMSYLLQEVATAICAADGTDPEEACVRSPGGAPAFMWTQYIPHAREALAVVAAMLWDTRGLDDDLLARDSPIDALLQQEGGER